MQLHHLHLKLLTCSYFVYLAEKDSVGPTGECFHKPNIRLWRDGGVKPNIRLGWDGMGGQKVMCNGPCFWLKNMWSLRKNTLYQVFDFTLS